MGVFTDPTVSKLDVFAVALESIRKEGIQFEVFDQTSVEPTDARSVQL